MGFRLRFTLSLIEKISCTTVCQIRYIYLDVDISGQMEEKLLIYIE